MVESTSYTPLWVTIVGYITTVVPCIVSIILEILNRKKQKTFEESLKEIKKAQANAIDKYKFLNEKNMILKKLNNFDLQLKKDLLGFPLANDILIVIVKIQGYANTIKFCVPDQDEISSFYNLVHNYLNVDQGDREKMTCKFREKIQIIKNIINKGEYS
ncbi:hypothetical protein CH238_13940 [[Clostridium] leptum DSM 753]|uniref:Uncharacterized protein n=1 Tax=[Clostridium] leptum DSM 753 TaxID=428125 RepID=A0A855A0V6_9FIRM|nr:hypothetical protein [[Clostridium] innocuum]PEQ23379.1 hypothetical protein CH238_13940 [[Clostridium] leptum DSM 753]